MRKLITVLAAAAMTAAGTALALPAAAATAVASSPAVIKWGKDPGRGDAVLGEP